MSRFLFLGLGYSVAPLVTILNQQGHHVAGTTRAEEKARQWASLGISAHIWDSQTPLPAELLADADVVVISAGPGPEGCPVLNALPKAAVRPEVRFLYLSSSGVYGDHQGAWVDEDTPPTPTGRRGQIRLQAEEGWRDLAAATETQLTLCRLSGIYGPGRNALRTLKGGTRGASAGLGQRVIKPGQVFNRIHRGDIVGGLQALIQMEAPPLIVNFADDEPSPPQDVITYAARLLDIPPPPEVDFEKAELSPMARSFYSDNKRLCNARLKDLPGMSLLYPSYRVGLKALLKGMAA